MKEEYKKTELGWVPEEWEIKQLNDISEIIMGQSPDSDTYNDNGEGVPFFQGKTEFGRISPIIKKWCTKPTKIAKPLDILLSVRAPVGEVNINVEESCIGRGLAAIRGKNSNYKFIYYYMQSIKTKLNSSAQGSTFTAINSNDLKEVKIIVPPLKEQEKIADILSTVDYQIDDTDKLIEKTKELKKGLMQRLLTKGIGHMEFKKTEVGEIPVEWKVDKFKNITDILRCGVASTPTYVEEGVPFLSAQNIQDGKLSLHKFNLISTEYHEKLTKNDKPQYGDILYSRVGANYGIAAVVNVDFEFSVYVSLTFIRMKQGNDSEFFKYLLNSAFCKKQADVGVFQGAGVPNLNVKIVEEFKMIVPPLEEQKQIASILSSVDKQIEEYENKKLKLEELKRGLMQQLLTGKIRVI